MGKTLEFMFANSTRKKLNDKKRIGAKIFATNEGIKE